MVAGEGDVDVGDLAGLGEHETAPGSGQHCGDPVGRDPGIRSHLPHQLEQADASQMRLAAREQPRARGRDIFEPVLHRRFGAARDGHQSLFRSLAAEDQERLPFADRGTRQGNDFARTQARPVEKQQDREVARATLVSAGTPKLREWVM